MKLVNEEREDKSLPFVRVLVAGILIAIVGLYLRFAPFTYAKQVADLVFGVAIIIIFKTVFDWMKKTADHRD